MSFEETLKKSCEDVEKLNQQIENMLSSLLQDSELVKQNPSYNILYFINTYLCHNVFFCIIGVHAY